MYSKVCSGCVYGIEGRLIQVEADVSDGFPVYSMVGYLASEVKEAKERVTTALRNSGFKIPPKRIIINLSPADLRKEGTVFDLPIALSILCSLGYLTHDALQNKLIIGELSLNGKILPVRGVLSIILKAREHGLEECLVPMGNVREAAIVDGITVVGVKDLMEVIEYLNDLRFLPAADCDSDCLQEQAGDKQLDFADVYGQEILKRCIEIAVSGMHHLMIIGPPGAGKSMAVRRIPGVMPPMAREELMEVAKIYSAAGLMNGEKRIVRPFRDPHHTITVKGMSGGGSVPKPGEISLAHHGILFLDEILEFDPQVLEVLRQPLENREVTISRVNENYVFPAGFLFVGAMNPCKCGNYPDQRKCTCSYHEIRKYLKKLSQPMLDRIDLCADVNAVSMEQILARKQGKSSRQMRTVIQKARRMQEDRFREEKIRYNSQMDNQSIEKFCRLSRDAQTVLWNEMKQQELSARAYFKIIKVARTIADMDEDELIHEHHVQEAVCFRTIDKKYWGSL